MNNKSVKQSIVDVALKGRKLFWFGEHSEKFIANSIEDVFEAHREWIGDEDTDDIIGHGYFGEIKMSVKEWWHIKCWNEETGQLEPLINAVYGQGLVQVCTSYA